MLFLRICIFICCLATSAVAYAEDIAIVTSSSSIKIYNEVIQGFESVSNNKYTIIETSGESPSDVIRSIRLSGCRAVLAIGVDAYRAVKEITDLPVIVTMVYMDNMYQMGRENIAGINLSLSPKKHLDEIKSVLPGAKRIGVVYNPEVTGGMFTRAESVASDMRLTLVGKPVSSAGGVTKALMDMKGEIDALWMLPDVSLINFENVKFMLLYSFENMIPIVAISDKYTKDGALMSSSIDGFEIGRQAGEITNQILGGKRAGDIGIVYAREGNLSINLLTAGRLKLKIPEDALKRAYMIHGDTR